MPRTSKPEDLTKEITAFAELLRQRNELLAALKVAKELLERNGIMRVEIDAAIARAEGQ
jgi:hypothetical protein